MSQLVRARTVEAGSARTWRAVTGLIEAARRAGSSAATSVITRPAASPAARIGGVNAGPSNSTLPAMLSQPVATRARTAPRIIPTSEPAMPSISPCASTKPTTWLRAAPAARSRPSSRIRSTTVIASVLRITNAAANSAIAASNAIVDRMSAVEARSAAATSAGDVIV